MGGGRGLTANTKFEGEVTSRLASFWLKPINKTMCGIICAYLLPHKGSKFQAHCCVARSSTFFSKKTTVTEDYDEVLELRSLSKIVRSLRGWPNKKRLGSAEP